MLCDLERDLKFDLVSNEILLAINFILILINRLAHFIEHLESPLLFLFEFFVHGLLELLNFLR